MSIPPEPDSSSHTVGLRTYFLATRPMFLSLSLISWMIGTAYVWGLGASLNPIGGVIVLIGAILMHASINVFNDYCDAESGCDRINQDRLYPFSGGSRFIQNGVMTPGQTLTLASVLLGLAAIAGLILWRITDPGFLIIGLVGVLIGWGYSSPRFGLNANGWGEISVAVGFGILIPLAAAYVYIQVDSVGIIALTPSYALAVAGILIINQFPDQAADAASGKNHWIVRLGPRRGAVLFSTVVAASIAMPLWLTMTGLAPVWMTATVIALIPLMIAAVQLYRFEGAPGEHLRPPIQMTIGATLLHGLALCGVMLLLGN